MFQGRSSIYSRKGLTSATETDLAIAFGQNIFFLASTLKATQSLRNAIGDKIFDKTEKFKRCFKPLHTTNKTSSEMSAGGMKEANELRRRHNQELRIGWEDAELTRNGRMLLQN